MLCFRDTLWKYCGYCSDVQVMLLHLLHTHVNMLSFLIENVILTPAHLELARISCLACWAIQKQEGTSLPYFILLILSFFLFLHSTAGPRLPQGMTLMWYFPLCAVFLLPTSLCSMPSANSFALWLLLGSFSGEELAKKVRVHRKCQEDILLATSPSGPSGRLPVTIKSALSGSSPPSSFLSSGCPPSFSLPVKPRSGGISLLLTAWRHCTSEPL